MPMKENDIPLQRVQESLAHPVIYHLKRLTKYQRK